MVALRKPNVTHNVESDGYARYRGRGSGKRGQPSIQQRDLFEARIALRSIERAVANLELAADESRVPFERDEHHRVALGQLSLVWRAVERVLDRNHKRLRRRGPY